MPMPEIPREAHSEKKGAFRFDRQDVVVLALFLILFAITRFLWAHENISAVTYWEDEYRWTAANELLLGPAHDLFEYQADHYQGGPLVMILTIAGLFLVVGSSPLVLKSVAVFFGGLTLALLYSVARVGFGRPTAILAAAAYLVGPPLVAVSGLFVMGSHGESIVFSLLQFLIFYRLLSVAERTPRTWFAFGLVSGLGLWFCYTSGLSLAACGLTFLAIERFPLWREIRAALLGGLVGLLPWFAYNVERSFVGLGRIGEVFGWSRAPDIWVEQSAGEKALQLIFRDWPGGLLLPFPTTWPDSGMSIALVVFAFPMSVALGASLVRVVRSAPGLRSPLSLASQSAICSRRELVFLVYGALWLVFFLGSRFTIDPYKGIHEYRLFLPAAVIVLIPMARSATLGLSGRGWVRAVSAVGVACVLILSSVGTVAAVSRPREVKVFRQQFGNMVRGLLLHRKYERSLEEAVRVAEEIPSLQSHYAVYRGIGWGVAYGYEKSGDWKPVAAAVELVPESRQRAFRSGIRWAARAGRWQINSRMKQGIPRADSETLLERFNALMAYVGTKPARTDTAPSAEASVAEPIESSGP